MSDSQLSLTGRTVIVTGAARGLGRAEAVALAARGARVLAVDRLDTSETVAALRADGCEATGLELDLADRDNASGLVEAALAAYGAVDVVVNNAGVVRDRMSFNLSDDDWEHVLAVNLSATFYVARAAIRQWRAERHGSESQRSIINTSSESGLYGNAGQANYSAAKAGVAALTRTLATEVDGSGIRVNAVVPRARTPMSEGMGWKLPRGDSFDALAPEHVASVVAWLASDAARDVNGRVLVVHGGVIDVMQTWSAHHRVSHRGNWTDNELLALRDELFPGGAVRAVAAPIQRLFSGAMTDEEAIDDRVDSRS